MSPMSVSAVVANASHVRPIADAACLMLNAHADDAQVRC